MSPILSLHQNKKMTSLKWRLICNYHIYMWPVTRKGTSWVSYSEIHFSAFWKENFMTNPEILTCWWVLDHFGSQNVKRRWVPPWSVTNFLLTLLLRCMYKIKSRRLTHIIKYCKKTLQCICCNQFSFVLFYLLLLSFFLLYFFLKCRTRYFSSLQLHFSVNT